METSTLVCQAVSQAVHGSAPYEPPSLPDGPVLNPLRKYTMKKPTKEQVIHRAYELWEQAGKPEGRDDEFYHQAERELNEAEDPEQETLD